MVARMATETITDKLPSRFQLGDKVRFKIGSGINEDQPATVVGIKFTKPKVRYDLYLDHIDDVLDGIDSLLVEALS